MNFWCSIILVQLKVALKSDFLKFSVSVWNDFTSNVDTLDRKSWILNGDLWFQFKVKWKYDFLKCPVSILNDSTSNVDTLDRKSWILNADIWIQFKVKWKYDFLKCQKLFLYLLEINSLLKQGYRGIRQKHLNFRWR